MNAGKITQFFSDARTIGASILLLFTVLVWAQDTRYVTYVALDTRDIKQIRREIADLQIEKRYANTTRDRQKAEDKIQKKEQQIKEIKGE